MQSEVKDAPWNQKEPTPIEVECSVCYCMSKSMPVQVMNYETTEDVSGSLYDEGTEYFFDDTNFIQEFNNDSEALGIPALLSELRKLAEEKKVKLMDEYNLTHSETTKIQIKKEIFHCNHIIVSATGWTVDDMDVIKED